MPLLTFLVLHTNVGYRKRYHRGFHRITLSLCHQAYQKIITMGYSINHLRELESEAIYVLREVAAQFENPCILFSGGKDSILLTHLAKKAFYPAKIPFPLVHIDTGHNFPETLTFRDNLAKELQAKLIVGSVQSMIDRHGPRRDRS